MDFARLRPFDLLSPEETDYLRANLERRAYAADATVIPAGAANADLHIIESGSVAELQGGAVLAEHGPGDSFDFRAVLDGGADRDFRTREAAILLRAPRAVVMNLAHRNAAFAAALYLGVGRKLLGAAETESETRLGTLTRARVRDAHLSPAVFINSTDTIERAGHTMRERNTNALFVRDALPDGSERIGIITGMNLSKACVLERMPISAPVRVCSNWDVVEITEDAFVFDAMVKMTRFNKRRLAVVRDGAYIGVIDDVDLLGLLTSNSTLLAGRIERATSLDDLAAASRDIARSVVRLRRQGMPAAKIAEITSDQNRRLFARLFEKVAPPSIREHGCLIVMGSEGRGEQTIRTDQDNGLILAQPVDPEDLRRFQRDFSGALEAFGFPPCPGNVMVSNPEWTLTAQEFRAEVRRHVAIPGEASHMKIAILIDAQAVAGRADLMATLRGDVFDAVAGNDMFLAHFSRAIDSFKVPLGLFRSLIASDGDRRDQVDLKKGGVFPIVHGVRSLALRRRIAPTGTLERILGLDAAGVFDHAYAEDLSNAFRVLMDFSLDAQLRAQTEGGRGSLVRPADLTSLEQNLLRDVFSAVNRLRELVRHSLQHGAI